MSARRSAGSARLQASARPSTGPDALAARVAGTLFITATLASLAQHGAAGPRLQRFGLSPQGRRASGADRRRSVLPGRGGLRQRRDRSVPVYRSEKARRGPRARVDRLPAPRRRPLPRRRARRPPATAPGPGDDAGSPVPAVHGDLRHGLAVRSGPGQPARVPGVLRGRVDVLLLVLPVPVGPSAVVGMGA